MSHRPIDSDEGLTSETSDSIFATVKTLPIYSSTKPDQTVSPCAVGRVRTIFLGHPTLIGTSFVIGLKTNRSNPNNSTKPNLTKAVLF